MSENVYEHFIDEFKTDPHYKAEYALLNLTEAICAIHPKQGKDVRFFITVIEWAAEKAIYLLEDK